MPSGVQTLSRDERDNAQLPLVFQRTLPYANAAVAQTRVNRFLGYYNSDAYAGYYLPQSSIIQDTTVLYNDRPTYKIVSTGANTEGLMLYGEIPAAGTAVTTRVWFRAPAGKYVFYGVRQENNFGQTIRENEVSRVLATGDWQTVTIADTRTAGAATAFGVELLLLNSAAGGSVPAGLTLQVAQPLIEWGTTVGGFFDGDSAPRGTYSWSGAPQRSSSVQVATPVPTPERGFFNYTETHYTGSVGGGGSTQTDTFTGTNGAAPSASNFAVAMSAGSSATIQSNALRMVTGTTGGYSDVVRATSTLAAAADVDVLLDWTPTTTAEAYASIMVRDTGATDVGANGYKFELSSFGSVAIQRVASYSGTGLGSASVPGFAAGVQTHLRVKATGTLLQVWAWTTGSQPATPTVQVTDTGITGAGKVGFFLNGGSAASSVTWTADNWSATTVASASAAGHNPLVLADLQAKRAQGQTMVFRYYVIERYRTADTIEQAYLDLIAADIATARAAGVKLIVRFTYSTAGNISAAPYSSDTTVARILGHISQLAPTLNAGADIIDSLEAGFIGMWGEWYYTDNFGDLGVANAQQLADRKAVVDALLTNLDPRIYVLLRYVGTMRTLIDSAPGNTGYATRLGNHNDAFLASSDDYGTYTTFSPTYNEAQNKAWLQARVTTGAYPQLGESAVVNSPRSLYPSAATELTTYRWTSLNPLFFPDVLASWGQDGRDDISARLGYRLTLGSATATVAGSNVNLTLSIDNSGYAAPYRDRPIQVVFVNGSDVYTRTLTTKARSLGLGTTTITESVAAPPVAATYAVHLLIPDTTPALATNPLYSVAFTNPGIFDPATGRNSTGQAVAVTTSGVSGTATLGGSGSLTGSGVSAFTGAANLNGSGSLTAAGASAVTGTAATAGSGQLIATGTATASTSAALTGSGQLTAVGSVGGSSSVALTGSGSLTATGKAATTANAALTGTGTLSATGAAAEAGTVSVNLTGSGTLAANGTASLTRVVTFTGSGALTTSATPRTSATVNLSGSGTLTVAGVAGGRATVGFAGSGELTVATAASLTALANLTGSGDLSAIRADQVYLTHTYGEAGIALHLSTASLTGDGVSTASLTSDGTSTATIAAHLSTALINTTTV